MVDVRRHRVTFPASSVNRFTFDPGARRNIAAVRKANRALRPA
jgi:hypothetical protein